MPKDIKKYIRDIIGTKVENIKYFIFYIFFKPRVVINGRKDLRGYSKGVKKLCYQVNSKDLTRQDENG
jgi:hypothetical protein